MNKPKQTKTMARMVINTADLAPIKLHQQRVATTSLPLINEAAITNAILAVRIRLFMRDQEKLESRPLT